MERTVSKISIAGEQHKFSSPSPNDSQAPFEALRKGRAREIYLFFADFWRATPHPAGQVRYIQYAGCTQPYLPINLANCLVYVTDTSCLKHDGH